jgi:hypothetical protein
MSAKSSSSSFSIFPEGYFVVQKSGLSQFQAMTAYLGGSAFQTIMDNPVTAYRQLVQQYAKDANGNAVDPKVARAEAQAIFRSHPLQASLSGVGPRLVGVGTFHRWSFLLLSRTLSACVNVVLEFCFDTKTLCRCDRAAVISIHTILTDHDIRIITCCFIVVSAFTSYPFFLLVVCCAKDSSAFRNSGKTTTKSNGLWCYRCF